MKDTPKNVGARGIGKSGVPLENPTLDELGLTKKTSALAQKLADLPEEQFEEVRTGTASVAQAIRGVEHAKRPSVLLPDTTGR